MAEGPLHISVPCGGHERSHGAKFPPPSERALPSLYLPSRKLHIWRISDGLQVLRLEITV